MAACEHVVYPDTDAVRVRTLLARRAEAEAAWLSRMSRSPANAGLGTPTEDSEIARRRRIEEAAYFRAERRGFAPGSELLDWLAAEAELDAVDQDRIAP
jgi:hypothetical protein